MEYLSGLLGGRASVVSVAMVVEMATSLLEVVSGVLCPLESGLSMVSSGTSVLEQFLSGISVWVELVFWPLPVVVMWDEGELPLVEAVSSAVDRDHG